MFVTTIFYCLILLLCCSASVDKSFNVACKFSTQQSAVIEKSCNVALFNKNKDFRINGTVISVDSMLCEPLGDKLFLTFPAVALVKRGCRKSENAKLAGFKAVIIVNTDDMIFPPGGEQSAGLVPTVMIGHSFWDYYLSTCDADSVCPEMTTLLVFDTPSPVKSHSFSQPPPDISTHPVVLAGYCAVFLACVIVAMTAALRRPLLFDKNHTGDGHRGEENSSDPSEAKLAGGQTILVALGVLVIVLLTGALRSATLRTRRMQPIIGAGGFVSDRSQPLKEPESVVVWNHLETDEVIFETLVAGVLRDPLHYSLRDTGIVELFQLSSDNYGDSLFIHPPVFVYSLAAFSHLLSLPLPAVSVLYHLLTLLLLLPLSTGLLAGGAGGRGWGGRNADAGMVGLWAALLYSMCPIAALCSQKVWIDNAATLAVTLCATVHVHVVTHPTNPKSSYLANFLSGLLFGLVAMNTKITCLALLPFLVLWSWVCTLFSSISSGNCIGGLQIRIVKALVCTVCLVSGVAVGHAPWVTKYYVTTGRLFPNAWPSQQMIDNSAYLQGAIGKHTFSYITGLFAISPVHTVGLMYAAAVMTIAVYRHLHSPRAKDTFPWRHGPHVDVVVAVLLSWPLAFLGGLTFIGALGGGFQIRFILPILPATAILTGIAVVNAGPTVSPFVSLLCCVSAMHVLYYSVLYSPLFADMDNSVLEIVAKILNTTLDTNGSKESMYRMFQVMQHYGFVAK